MEGPRRKVLMGRDLSAGGMRIEAMAGLEVGERFRIAIYGPGCDEPYLLEACVVRDDGESGLGLAFENVPEEVAEALEKLVACLPDVESLEDDEACGLGAVISEILDAD
jgi:c-di-GMP-binding flagellar brake protein YcgR